MKKALWLLGASFAAALASGAAGAEDKFSLDRFGGMEAPRVVPQPKSKQSPAATACATGGGRVALDARIAACTNLINSGQWKGKDIGWAYANRCAVYSAQGRDDKALPDCVQAISLDPDSVIPYQIRGDIAVEAGRVRQGARRLRQRHPRMARDTPPSLSIAAISCWPRESRKKPWRISIKLWKSIPKARGGWSPAARPGSPAAISIWRSPISTRRSN